LCQPDDSENVSVVLPTWSLLFSLLIGSQQVNVIGADVSLASPTNKNELLPLLLIADGATFAILLLFCVGVIIVVVFALRPIVSVAHSLLPFAI